MRGLNCGRKRGLIRNMLRSRKCLQETKLQGEITEIIKDVWGSKWVDYIQLEASGTWGVVIMWDRRFWDRDESSVGEYSYLLQTHW